MEKRGFIYYLRIYGKILSQDIKSKMSYRADFIISTVGMIATNIAGVVTFWLIFQNFPSIKGWNYYEMLFLYGFSLIATTPAQCFFGNNWNLRNYVYSGDFIKYCFRPINLFFYYMSEIFDIKGVGQFVFGIATVAYEWVKLALPFHWYSILELLVAAVSASLFMIALLNASAATCFWVMNSYFVMALAFSFRDYSKYPVTIFGPVIRLVFTFLIPMAFMSYYPCQLFLRSAQVPILTWFTPVFGVLFFYLSYKIWMKGAMSYNGTGS